jgi:hypothetical protein
MPSLLLLEIKKIRYHTARREVGEPYPEIYLRIRGSRIATSKTSNRGLLLTLGGRQSREASLFSGTIIVPLTTHSLFNGPDTYGQTNDINTRFFSQSLGYLWPK